jgi:cytochrome c
VRRPRGLPCLALAVALACARGGDEFAGFQPPATPDSLAAGASSFNAQCRECHGEHAKGTDRGPSLLADIYRPDHHGDAAFLLAVRNGVRAHHWRFGDMPPQPSVAERDVLEIIAYVRWLQRHRRQTGERQTEDEGREKLRRAAAN